MQWKLSEGGSKESPSFVCYQPSTNVRKEFRNVHDCRFFVKKSVGGRGKHVNISQIMRIFIALRIRVRA